MAIRCTLKLKCQKCRDKNFGALDFEEVGRILRGFAGMNAYSHSKSRNIAQSGVPRRNSVLYERLLHWFTHVSRWLLRMPAREEMKGRHSVDRILFPTMKCTHGTAY